MGLIQKRLTLIPWTGLCHEMLAGLHPRTNVLNLTVTGIGSQWRKHSRCVTWEYFERCNISWATVFWMSCRGFTAYPGKSANNDLLQIKTRAHQGLHQNLNSFPGKKRSDLAECLQEESACLSYMLSQDIVQCNTKALCFLYG